MPPRAFAQASAGKIDINPLSDNLFLLTGAGANVIARTGSEGVLLVDGGLAERAATLAAAVAALPRGRPVRTLLNTHWHPEQTGSNLILGRSGAAIVSHENTRLWLSKDINRPGEATTFKRLPKEALPNKTFYEKESIDIDGERLELGYLLQAHTDGDIYVLFPNANVLVIGDVISADAWPYVDWWTGGWINGIVSALDTLLKVANPQTRIVAAQGPMLTRADLESQYKMFGTIAQRLRTMMFGGKSLSDAIAGNPTKEFDVRMGDPSQFVKLAFQSMWGHFTPDA